SGPGPPLVAVDGSQLAGLVGPLVPDPDLALLQPADVGVAAEEPEQLPDDGAKVQALGGEDGEAVGEVEAHLVAEDRQRAGAGAVVLAHALGADPLEEVEVGLHGSSLDVGSGLVLAVPDGTTGLGRRDTDHTNWSVTFCRPAR